MHALMKANKFLFDNFICNESQVIYGMLKSVSSYATICSLVTLSWFLFDYFLFWH